VCLIVVFASLVLRDQGVQSPLGGLTPSGGVVLWAVPLCHAALGLVVQVTARRTLRSVERTGSLRPLETLDMLVAASRVGGAALTAGAVVLLGYLDAVRAVVGDTVGLDEALTVLPFLLLVVWGWWAVYPVEKLLRDSTFIRDLDDGRPIYPPPGRGAFVWGQVRHQLFLLLLPMAFLMIWSDAVDAVARGAHGRHASGATDLLASLGGWIEAHQVAGPLAYWGAKLVGLCLIIAGAPLAIRRVWDTVPLEEGAVAAGLLEMCRVQGVRVRRLLVWRTGGTMINGAVLGVVGRARYILLTDALLDLLPGHCVQAVMAHEVGHVRCRHVPWLTATLFAACGTALVLISAALKAATGVDVNDAEPAVQLAASAGALGLAVLAFGYVSRRFEWQADAFAAKHFSLHTAPTDDPGAGWAPSPTVTRPAVAAMCAALEIVATANHLPRERFTFRHGSIATRVNRLSALEGRDVKGLPIDGVSRRIKLAVAGACVLVVLSAFGVV